MYLTKKDPRMRYLTRDLDVDGKLSPWVDVWCESPVRLVDEDATTEWLSGHEDDELRGHLRHVDYKECQEEFGTCPDNDVQLICIGRFRLN